MKPAVYKNIVNGERFVCDDLRHIELIDGVEYLVVHRIGEHRTFKMRRDTLRKENLNLRKLSAKTPRSR